MLRPSGSKGRNVRYMYWPDFFSNDSTLRIAQDDIWSQEAVAKVNKCLVAQFGPIRQFYALPKFQRIHQNKSCQTETTQDRKATQCDDEYAKGSNHLVYSLRVASA